MKLLLASTNRGKAREIQEALSGLFIELVSLREFTKVPEVIEDGLTFEANARLKARIYGDWSGLLTLADDSGLVVEALGGAPGVLSARYAGLSASDEQNNRKLIEAIHNIPQAKRQAAFVCALALYDPQKSFSEVFEGRMEGEIISEPRGLNGFGYDPHFWVPSLGKTTAELELEEKNKISHRGKALEKLMKYLSGRQDSNLRPPAPKAGALPG